MTPLGPIPAPEKKRNVTPIRTGKNVAAAPAKTLGIQPSQKSVTPGASGSSKGPEKPPGAPTVSVDRLFVGKAPPTSMTGPSSPEANHAPITLSVKPGSTAQREAGRLGQIVATPKIQAARYLSGPVRFSLTRGAPCAPKDRSGIAIVGRFEPYPWGEVPAEKKLADALETLGVKVYRVDQFMTDPLPPQAAWMFFTDDSFSWGRLAECSRSHPTALWTQEWTGDRPEKRTFLEAALHAKLFVTADRFDWAKAYGIRQHFYLPGACEPEAPEFAPRPLRPCAYLGSTATARQQSVADLVRRLGGEVLDKEKMRPYGPAFARYVQDTKIVVEESARNDVPGYRSPAVYAILGAGGFLLASDANGIREDFHPGSHLELYDSLENLERSIKNYLANEEVRETIRKAGFWYARNHFTWDTRARALLGRLRLAAAEVKV